MRIFKRLLRINFSLWGYLLWWGVRRTGFIRPRVSPAERFVSTLENLGTTFVKLGQGLSLHSELLPDDFVIALQKLQDHVGPFPGDLACAEIERSFGRPLSEVFSRFDIEPFAAGSMAQVHKATMLDGRVVIVKVRRIGIKRQIEEDIHIFRWFLKSVLWIMPGLRRLNTMDIVDELSRNLHKEIGFRQEAASIKRFAEIFRGSATIHIPLVIDDLYSDWVIVQEMSTGRRIDAPEFLADGPRLAQNLVDAYLLQFFEAGVFHGDPHPGNLFVLSNGKICLHDFGLVGFLDKSTRANLIAFMQAFVQQDGEWLLDAYLDLGVIAGTIDRREFRMGLEELIQDYSRLPLRDWSFGEAFLRVARLGRGQNIRIPHHLLVMLRAIFLMESTVRKLDPNFSLLEGLFAKAGDTMQSMAGPAQFKEAVSRLQSEAILALKDAPASLSHLLRHIRSKGAAISVQHSGFEKLENEIKETGSRMSLALITLGLYIAASLLMQHSLGPTIKGIPVLAAIGYGLALWLTFMVVRSVFKTSR